NGLEAGLDGEFLGTDLVAHLVDHIRARSHERRAGRVAQRRQFRVLGQEAVPGVDQADLLVSDDPSYRVEVEVAIGRSWPTQNDRSLGQPRCEAVPVGL